MIGIREWLKANGGAPAVVVLGVGLVFAFPPLGIGVIAVGLLMWIYGWERFPFTVSRRARANDGHDRRELLGLAQAVSSELETCRYRLSEAKAERKGWFVERQLPAGTYNTRWTPSLSTADEVSVNDALRGFYVWADEMNGKMSRRAVAEFNSVGTVGFDGKTLTLDDNDLSELDEGLSRIENAQDLLAALTKRLGRN